MGGLDKFNSKRDIDEVFKHQSKKGRNLQERIENLETQEPPTQVEIVEALPYDSAADTVAAQTVIDKTIEGGSMGANGNFAAYFDLIIMNDTGSARNFTFDVFFGGGSIFSAAVSVGNGASSSVLHFEVHVGNKNDPASQYYFVSTALVTTTPIDALSVVGDHRQGYDSTTIDTSSDQVFRVTITMAIQNADLSWELFAGRFMRALAV